MNPSTSNTRAFNLNLFKIVEDYFERMLEEVPGMKCLILDRETMGTNPIYSLHL